ncbi:NAD(P)H-binding protein [Mycobacterium sp. MYCO198283]|uniref:NAD(P)-dependent oxidoreductase n=1 Tax=Mycobacterium sp. MYCO198283 TaxID=2883505 RepID=UPI001E630D8A|nr:NAD(P)H-binding protein [Mycobacterium sp. MYCO198283]MCG5433344.1 NAD(P)H-binding protein [Mycobacterium sp. MYCO198283]
MTGNARHLVVLGAAGRTGRLIVGEALRAGCTVTAVIRDPQRADQFQVPGVTLHIGDSRDPSSWVAALRPDRVVVSAVGHKGRRSNGLYGDTARAVIAAQSESGAGRFVGITSCGVRLDDPGHRWWYRHLLAPLGRSTYADMSDMERLIAASDLEWTFVRPGRLDERQSQGAYRIGDGAIPPGGIGISRSALAQFVVQCATSEEWIRRYPTITR